MQFLQKRECSCGSPKTMQIKGCTQGAAAGDEPEGSGEEMGACRRFQAIRISIMQTSDLEGILLEAQAPISQLP